MQEQQDNVAAGRRAAAGAEVRRQFRLPLREAAGIAWRGIRMRLGRSLLATAGVALAVAFLSYVLCREALLAHVAAAAPPELLRQLRGSGALAGPEEAGSAIQTWWLVGVALLAGFAGVLHAMLLSVTERMGEIGTMKCLGALDGLIVRLFLLEGLFHGLIGSAAGAAAGLALAVGEALAAGIGRLVPLGRLAALAGLCVLAGAGLTLAGTLYPAWRAARLQPAEAMRTEV